jgi:hypothetical protein
MRAAGFCNIDIPPTWSPIRDLPPTVHRRERFGLVNEPRHRVKSVGDENRRCVLVRGRDVVADAVVSVIKPKTNRVTSAREDSLQYLVLMKVSGLY